MTLGLPEMRTTPYRSILPLSGIPDNRKDHLIRLGDEDDMQPEDASMGWWFLMGFSSKSRDQLHETIP